MTWPSFPAHICHYAINQFSSTYMGPYAMTFISFSYMRHKAMTQFFGSYESLSQDPVFWHESEWHDLCHRWITTLGNFLAHISSVQPVLPSDRAQWCVVVGVAGTWVLLLLHQWDTSARHRPPAAEHSLRLSEIWNLSCVQLFSLIHSWEIKWNAGF